MTAPTLLAVGGPRHGDQLPLIEGRTELVVPIPARLDDWVPVRWCVHGQTVLSATDGQSHFVSADRVAYLYGLSKSEWYRADRYPDPWSHPVGDHCLFPDATGRYRLPRHDLFTTTIQTARYSVRVVSDRAVWVYVGS